MSLSFLMADEVQHAAAGVALAALLASGCGSPDETVAPPEASALGVATAVAEQALVGVDGPLTVNAAGTLLNQYAILAANAAAGDNSVTVTSLGDLTSPTFGALAKGDIVMIIQMQGAAIDTQNSATYGSINALGNAGRYEIITVGGTVGNLIDLDVSCGGLKNAYSAAGNVQVVRVPQLTSLTINASGSITAPPWDGQRGGVVAVHALTSVTLDGPINVTGLGFRGGALDNGSQGALGNITLYRSANNLDGAEKGEGIAGSAATYAGLSGAFGRGAPANGGGGGNSHNAGGGGGANGNSGSAWTGQGVMDPSSAFLAAWMLDPGYIAAGGLTTSSGGGRGGYTYSSSNQNALLLGPGQAAWAGDSRLAVGGLGGRPVENDSAARLFFGGGGGAGDGNNGSAGAGGRGGGIVFVLADTVSGTSSILANGTPGQSTSAAHNDAPGGGGAGGTVIVRAQTSLSGIAIEANGGAGGNQLIVTTEGEGPGGGGGGGFIALHNGAVTTSALGGVNGTTTSASLTEFIPNGATQGATGQANASSATVVTCLDTLPDTIILTGPLDPTSDTMGDFTFSATEPGATFECSIDGSAFAPCASTFATGPLAAGPHTLAVLAIDATGNADPTPAMYTWTIVSEGDEDLDEDGLTDAEEAAIGTDPADADSDDDGVIDGQEIDRDLDSDDDGSINALDPDSDGDHLFDGTELGNDCSDPATDPKKGTCVPDADMGATTTSPVDPDTDEGGALDGEEDTNFNGQIDSGETDPNNASDDVPLLEQCLLDSDCGLPTSGVVCDATTATCKEGCRGAVGNGCPSVALCTSGDASIGACVVPNQAPDNDIIAAGSGVLCSFRPVRSAGSCPWLAVAALGALTCLRRCRRHG